MSHLKRGNTSPAHFKGNLLLLISSSFSTWVVQMNNGLAVGQLEPRDTSERKIGREKGSKVSAEVRGKEEQSADKELLFPSICAEPTHRFKHKLTHLSLNVNI